MPRGIKKDLVKLFAMLHQQNIQEGTLILTLKTLLYPDATDPLLAVHPLKERINFYNTFFSHVRQFDSPLIYSALGLAQCFKEGKKEFFKRVHQEIEDKKDLLMPGILQHIGMGILFDQLRGTKKLDSKEYAGPILHMAIIDLLQNPLLEKMIRGYHPFLENKLKRYNIDDRNKSGWRFINDTLENISSSQFEALKDAFYNLVVYAYKLTDVKYIINWDEIAESYLRTHPQSVNKIIVDAFKKNYALAEKFQAIPLLWYIAFLDQWLHDKKHFPKHLPMTIKWLDEHRKSYFNYFCGKNKERKAFLNLFLLYGFPQYLLSYPSRIIETENGETTYFKPVRAFKRLFARKPLDHKHLVYLLESIDQERFYFLSTFPEENSFLYFSVFRDKSYQNINDFSELHTFLEERFQSTSARRAAYLLFLLNNGRIHKDLSGYTHLMKNRFYADKYALTPRDVVLILLDFAHRNYTVSSIRSKRPAKRKLDNKTTLFVHTFLDLLYESLPALSDHDERIRDYILKWIYMEFARSDTEPARIIKDKLSLLGFNVPLFDEYNLIAFSMPHFGEISNAHAGSKETKALKSSLHLSDLWNLSDSEIYRLKPHMPPQSKELLYIVKRWLQFCNQEQVVVGQVPLIYHPSYGYGVIYSLYEASIKRASHHYKTSLVILFHSQIDTPSIFLEETIIFDRPYNLAIFSLKSKVSPRELKKRLELRFKRTPLEGALVEFVEVKSFRSKSLFAIERKALLSMNRSSSEINSFTAAI